MAGEGGGRGTVTVGMEVRGEDEGCVCGRRGTGRGAGRRAGLGVRAGGAGWGCGVGGRHGTPAVECGALDES